MGVITNIRIALRFKHLYLAVEAVKKIINWPLYFLDFCSLSIGGFTIFRMRNSLKYIVRSRTCDRGIITTVHLGDEYRIESLLFSGDSVVIDIGAHIGIFSVYVSKKARRVYAFEPVLENFNMLKRNIKLNNLENKVKVFNKAVYDNNKRLKIYFSKYNTGAHSAHGKGIHEEVECVTLKQVFDDNSINKCSLLKIDSEGAEYTILYSLPSDYFNRIERIYLEHHRVNQNMPGYNRKRLREYLVSKGYRVEVNGHMMFAKRDVK